MHVYFLSNDIKAIEQLNRQPAKVIELVKLAELFMFEEYSIHKLHCQVTGAMLANKQIAMAATATYMFMVARQRYQNLRTYCLAQELAVLLALGYLQAQQMQQKTIKPIVTIAVAIEYQYPKAMFIGVRADASELCQ